MGYDLRIDVYGDYRIGPVKKYSQIEPNQILKITKEFKRDEQLRVESEIKFKIDKVNEKKLNTIEDVHLQKFKNYHHKKVKEAEAAALAAENAKKVEVQLAKVMDIKPYSSPIFEKSFELVVQESDKTLTLLTRDESYKTGDLVCYLKKNAGDHATVLGLKPKQFVTDYLQEDFLKIKNIEANLIEFR